MSSVDYTITIVNTTGVLQRYSLFNGAPPANKPGSSNATSTDDSPLGVNSTSPGQTATFTISRQFYAICASSSYTDGPITQMESTPVIFGLESPPTKASVVNIMIDRIGYPMISLSQSAGSPAEPPGGFIIKTPPSSPRVDPREYD